MLIKIRYEQLTIRAANLREELHTEIERMLNDVIHFKIHIQKKLEDYEMFVDEEVSREVANLERGEEGGADDGNDANLGGGDVETEGAK
jgi:kinetochore protein NDC80